MAEFNIKLGNDYVKSYRNKDTGFEVGYYTAKEIKAAYPDGGIRVVGQLEYGKHEAGTLIVGGIEETVYRAESSIRYKAIGYIELIDGTFIAVKKDRIAALILLFLLGLLALAGLIFGVYYAVQNGIFDTPDEPVTTPGGMILEGVEGEGVWDKLEDEIDVSVKNITMRGITQINFIAGQKEQNFVLANDKKNADICFMQYSIYLDKNGNKKADDGDELLYESGLVQPGYAISRFSISRPLSEGTYSAVVVAQPYSLDKQLSKLNNMVFATEIIVKAPAK